MLEESWNELALPAESPFLTHQWLRSWWSAFAEPEPMVVALRAADGTLRAGACVTRRSARELSSAANEYSEDWDVVAVDDASRQLLWHEIAALGGARITLSAVPASSSSVGLAADSLRAAGFKVAVGREQASPYLDLPDSWEQLLAGVSRNLRSQVRRSAKGLQREGAVEFRTATDDSLERDLDAFLSLEASGWKGAAGSAIRSDPRALRLYTDFAHASMRKGWLRLQLLELDGVPIAADYTCVVGRGAFLVKTAFDERYGGLSPGLVLRAEALRSALGEGLRFYDFLGGADRYKMRWTEELRERLVIRGYGGVAAVAPFWYRHSLRPAARRLADRGRGGWNAAARYRDRVLHRRARSR